MAEYPPVELCPIAMQILEEAAFIFTEPVADQMAPEYPVLRAALDFAGPQSGRLTIAASPDFAVLLAANLLGVEPDDPDAVELRYGALGETLNMIAGALMENIFGNQEIVHLGIPEVTSVEAEPHGDLPADLFAVLLTEEEFRLDIMLHWNN